MIDADFFEGVDATWPAERAIQLGPWTLRQSDGGGKRVTATTASGEVTPAQITQAEAAMRDIGQTPLFQIRPSDTGLDTQLDQLGYRMIDPVTVMTIPVAKLAQTPPPITAFVLPEPLAIMAELWAEGGIGADRLAVMDRVTGPKAVVLGRIKDRASGAMFIAKHQKTVFCHALVVLEQLRRQGTARNMMWAASQWALNEGADTFATLVVTDNGQAHALFTSLGFTDVGQYHYRIKPE